MAISWQAALRLYAKKTGHFVLPKKGTEHYAAVKKLQGETADGPEHAIKKREKKGKKEVVVAETHEPTTGAKRAPTKKRKAAPEVTSNHAPLLPPAQGTKPIEAAGGSGSRAQEIEKKPEVKDAEAAPVKKRRGVRSSGLTAKAQTVEFLENDNVMGGGAASAQMPGQKKRIKQTLAKKKDEGKVVEVGEGEERTLEGMKTDDAPAIEGRQPFSFQALRNRLLC